MNLQQRIYLLSKLGEYILSNEPDWQDVKKRAHIQNSWFIPEFIDLAVKNINEQFLDKNMLEQWAKDYQLPDENPDPKSVGIVMAGNIPLVGFHDLVSVFITGNMARVKLSSKDSLLIKHLVEKMIAWQPEVSELIRFEEELLKGCNAYIATGSNNSSRYFNYYFAKYPHIIRRNKTSVAILTGNETAPELEKLADDVHQYFGLGCRNVTKLMVPAAYNFVPLLSGFKKYSYLADHHKYRNNYDYNLAIHIMNNTFYMTNGSVILVENSSVFSPVSQVHFEYYDQPEQAIRTLKENADIQCICGNGFVPFGSSQCPSVSDYADGVDTISFLSSLKN